MGESGLKSGKTAYETEEVTIDFTVSVSPKPISLVPFLFGTRKEHVLLVGNENVINKKTVLTSNTVFLLIILRTLQPWSHGSR